MTHKDPVHVAEAALMERFKEWAKSLGDGGMKRSDDNRYYPNRSVNTLKRAHDRGDGELFKAALGWLDDYSYKATPAAQKMAEIVKEGLEPWETVLLEHGQPWTDYVTHRQRAKLYEVLADTHAQAARELAFRAKLRAELDH